MPYYSWIPLRFLATALLFIYCKGVYAQTAPAVEWQRCLGSPYGEFTRSIQPTSDGGFIVAGFSQGDDTGDVMGHHGNATVPDIWVIKMDRLGKMEWQRSLGGSQSDEGGYILPTPDGGYILAGSSASTDCNITGNHGGMDFWLVKLNSYGGIEWQRMYGGSRIDDASSIAMAADGGYFIGGLTRSENGDVTGHHGNVDAWVIKVGNTGSLIWQKALGGSGFEHIRSIQSTPDGGCIAGGYTNSDDGDINGSHGSNDLWLIKLDNTGNIQWQKTLGGSMSDLGSYVQLTDDGGYIVGGHSNSSDGDLTGNRNSFDAWVVRLDAEGNIVWQNTYGGTGNESLYYIDKTPDGGFVFTGSTLFIADGDIKCNAGVSDLLLMKINAAGQLEWQKTMGGSNGDEGFFVRALDQENYIVSGNTSSPEIPGFHNPVNMSGDRNDYWIIKLSPKVSGPIVTIDPASATICAGSSATLTATVLYGGVSPVYQWTKNGSPVGTNSPNYTDQQLVENDIIRCTVGYGNICESADPPGSDEVTIKYKTSTVQPAITIEADHTYSCDCTEITFKANISNAGASPVYQWKVNGNNAGYNSPVFIINQLNEGDLVTCQYSDNNLCGLNETIASNSIRINNGSGVIPSVSIKTTANTTCKGEPVTFTAEVANAGSHPVYQWKINNASAGTNSPVFTSNTLSDGDMVSCTIQADPMFACAIFRTAQSNKIEMHVPVAESPLVSITTSADTICAGQSVSFTATAINAGSNPFYQWQVNGVNTDDNSRFFTTDLLSDGDIINCRITTDPSLACISGTDVVSEDIVITVRNGLPASITIAADRNEICTGETIEFTATSQQAGTAPAFQWILNNAVQSEQSPIFKSKDLRNGDQLFCRIIPGIGACSSIPDSSEVFTVIVKDTPIVYISPADTTVSPGTQVSLHAITTSTVSSVQWSPADKLINPHILSPQTVGLDESAGFELTVTNDQGCSSTSTAVIKVFTDLFMPTAFTPNNDGINDIYRIPPSATLTLKEFSVYDRWGTKLFSTKDVQAGWDGSFNGKRQNSGVYVYYLKSVINNKEVSLKGSFLLVR